jgi:diguanylate cyclase (GGDEF)-like protein
MCVNIAGKLDNMQGQLADLDRLVTENKALVAELAAMRHRLAELEQLADTDTLTPLANRRAFLRRLDHAIRHADRHGTSAALIFIDLDGLKTINDAHGHLAGDAALCHVAAQLKSGLRATDMVARIGGDEFALILDHASDADARMRMDHLVAELARTPFAENSIEIAVSLSWGLTIISSADSVDEAIARADAAMYAAKAAQRSDR